MALQEYRNVADAELAEPRTRVVDYRNHREIEQLIAHGWQYVGRQCWAAPCADDQESGANERKTFLPALPGACIRGDGLVLTYPVLTDVATLAANELDHDSLSSRVPTAGFSSYTTSKSAITGFTRGLARDLGKHGIRVNELAPGPIDTDMNPQDGPSSGFQRSLTILGRYGEPFEIARVAAFLASDEASYITGATFAVDGGTNV